PELGDQRQLLLKPLACTSVASGIALREGALADALQLRIRGLVAVREVRVAVAELLRQVEAETVCELTRSLDRIPIERQPLRHRLRRQEDAFAVAAPLALGPVERRAVADGDERVLKQRAAFVMGMDVPGDDRLRPDRLGELTQQSVAPRVPPLVRSLQLDEKVFPERRSNLGSAIGARNRQAMVSAPGEADEPFVQLTEQIQ